MSRDPEIVSKNMQKSTVRTPPSNSNSEKHCGIKDIGIVKTINSYPALLILFLPNTKSLFFVIVNFFMEKIGKV